MKNTRGGKFYDIGLTDDFMDMTSKAKTYVTTSNLKASAQQWKQSTEWKATSRMGENICNHISDEGLISKICKKKTNNLI